MSPNASAQRFVQDAEEKTMNSLTYLAFNSPKEDRKKTNLNIMIPNHNTGTVQSPRANLNGQPLSIERDEQNSSNNNATQLRRPILQGKIDSRAALGSKKTLNTVSTFSQVQQTNQSYKKLIHNHSGKFRESSDKPGEHRNKTSTPKHSRDPH